MGRKKSKRKQTKKKPEKNRSVDKISKIPLLEIPDNPEDIVHLRVSVRKGARIESVPLKKLERLANRKNLRWKYEDGWLTLFNIS